MENEPVDLSQAVPTTQGISGQAPIMIHASTTKGLTRIKPFVPEIRKKAVGASGNMDMSALVYGLDPEQGIAGRVHVQ
jgi:hypothetical protein